jgi:enterochelin esterase family protein
MPNESMEEDFVRSDAKPPGRRIWTQPSSRGPATRLLIFLDAELYLERVSAIQLVKQLEEERRIPSAMAVFVSNNGAAARHSDYVCDSAYAQFLSGELLPYLMAQCSVGFDGAVLIGLSLSGLAAAHAALTTNRFRVAVCQSPSFWWEGERLASLLPLANGEAPRFWVSVGDLETDSGVSHPPSGLLQGTSQRDSCERGSAALRAAGYQVASRVFPGGHDATCWRDDLALALPWATSA